jgi:hypothetical protein
MKLVSNPREIYSGKEEVSHVLILPWEEIP